MSFEPDLKVLKQNLEHWFKFDHLSPEQGIALLIGIEPDEESIEALGNWYKSGQDRDNLPLIERGFRLINGDAIGGEESRKFIERHNDTVKNQDYSYKRVIIGYETVRMHVLVEQYYRLFKYWNSGKHPEITPLSYFIGWSLTKDFHPEWLNDASELGLCKPAMKNTSPSDSIDRPLLSLERRTLLSIIVALCDKSKIQYEKRGAAAEIARLTEASNVRVSEDTISRVLKEIPSAVKEREK